MVESYDDAQQTDESSETKLFRYMASFADGQIEKEKEKGAILEPKKRWDEKDQFEFEQLPLSKLLDDPYYLGIGGDLFPEHRRDIEQLWEARKTHGTHTAVFEEGIGSGKTFKFSTIMWLEVTEVITKVNPLKYYGLGEKGQGIAFICMSRNATLAKEVTFRTVLPFFDCPFYREYFPPQVNFTKIEETRRFPSRLRFPKNIVVFPGTGSALSAIGYNVFGGCIDEANYLELVDNSKRAMTGRKYDAAEEVYNAIMARMRSRFLKDGKVPGLLVMMSNPRSTNDFLERIAIRARTDPHVFFRRRCTWQAHPKSRYSGKTFRYDVYNRRIVPD